jgi:hypothetical protein
VSPFPGPGEKRQASNATVGGVPIWRHDGAELFYVSARRDLMAVSVKAGGSGLEIGVPAKLFSPVPGVPGRDYDVSADGKQFFTFVGSEETPEEPLTLLQNWTALLKK